MIFPQTLPKSPLFFRPDGILPRNRPAETHQGDDEKEDALQEHFDKGSPDQRKFRPPEKDRLAEHHKMRRRCKLHKPLNDKRHIFLRCRPAGKGSSTVYDRNK